MPSEPSTPSGVQRDHGQGQVATRLPGADSDDIPSRESTNSASAWTSVPSTWMNSSPSPASAVTGPPAVHPTDGFSKSSTSSRLTEWPNPSMETYSCRPSWIAERANSASGSPISSGPNAHSTESQLQASSPTVSSAEPPPSAACASSASSTSSSIVPSGSSAISSSASSASSTASWASSPVSGAGSTCSSPDPQASRTSANADTADTTRRLTTVGSFWAVRDSGRLERAKRGGGDHAGHHHLLAGDRPGRRPPRSTYRGAMAVDTTRPERAGPPDAPHASSVEEVMTALGVDPDTGLSRDEVARR